MSFSIAASSSAYDGNGGYFTGPTGSLRGPLLYTEGLLMTSFFSFELLLFAPQERSKEIHLIPWGLTEPLLMGA